MASRVRRASMSEVCVRSAPQGQPSPSESPVLSLPRFLGSSLHPSLSLSLSLLLTPSSTRIFRVSREFKQAHEVLTEGG
eukprot:2251891-Rhodomonas_salina.1